MKDLIILLMGISVFSFYVISISQSNPNLKSISESDYILKKPWRLFFEFVMAFSGVTLIYAGYFVLDKSILMMVGGLFIIGVGLFSEFKKDLFTRIMHYFFAIGGLVMLGISFIFVDHWYITVFIAICAILATLLSNKNKTIYWLELLTIYPLFVGIIYMLFV